MMAAMSMALEDGNKTAPQQFEETIGISCSVHDLDTVSPCHLSATWLHPVLTFKVAEKLPAPLDDSSAP